MPADVELPPLPEDYDVFGANNDNVQDYARTCVAHATAARNAEIEALRAKTAVTMGVGAGDGSLFVHGDHESIKAAQAIVLQRDALRAEVQFLRSHRPIASKLAEAEDALRHVKEKLEFVARVRGGHGAFAGTYLIVTEALSPTAAAQEGE